MPTGWSGYLHNYLTNVNPGVTARARQSAFKRKVVALAVASIDHDSCEIPDHWAAVVALLTDPLVEDELLVDALMEDAHTLRGELLRAGASRQSNANLRDKLRLAVASGCATPFVPQPLFPHVWPIIAGEIAASTFERFTLDHLHWRAYALLSLAGYIQALSTTDLSKTAAAINALAQRSVLRMRGAVTRLPHEVRQRMIVDPPNATTSASWHQPQGVSRFLMEVGVAVERVKQGTGFLSSFLDPHQPVSALHRSAASNLPQGALPAIRRAIYLQYDSLVIAVLAYSGLKQLLRSRMQKLGLPHRSSNGRPYSPLKWLSKLALPSNMEAMIREGYDAAQVNTRNRLWHSSFFIVDQCRPEITQSIQRKMSYAAGPNYPESIARHATRLLKDLSQNWDASDIDLSWTTCTPLAPKTEQYLASLYWELDGSDVLIHQDQFRLFVDNVAPTLSSLIVSSIRSPPIEQLATLFLVLEGLIRHTYELLNIPTLELTVAAERQSAHVKMTR